jgi:hypothetical protein
LKCAWLAFLRLADSVVLCAYFAKEYLLWRMLMSKAMGQDSKLPNNEGACLTRSFDESTQGPGSQIDRYRWQFGDGPAILILNSDLKEIKAVIFKESSL